MPLRHAAQITYYDELGVAENAAPEEIRDAFRALVKILHPDHQTDEQLKEIAERQMRKLNAIYAVLSDSEKRRRYDEALDNDSAGTTIILSQNSTVKIRKLMERASWIGALALVIITMIWLSSENPVASQSPVLERGRKAVPATPQVALSADELAKMRSDMQLLQMERDAAVREVTRLRGAPPQKGANTVASAVEPAPAAQPSTPAVTTELPAPVLPSAPIASLTPFRNPGQKPAIVAANSSRPFAGFWFYTKPASAPRGKSSLYPPEFIETTITEQNGVVSGKYRSRYKIVDRAISPDVSFEFSGPASGSTVVCPWTGPGGSKGELTLKIAGDNSLKVDWTATELGSMQGLMTGTATLTRRID